MGAVFYRAMQSMLQVSIGATFPVRASNAGCLPREGGVIVAANHQSFLDPIALGITLPRHACFLARSSLMKHPPMKWILGGLSAIPIERDGVGKEGIRRCLECLDGGNVLVIFPEGTRTLDGRIAPFKPGIQLLLRRAKAPVVVAGISGSYESWPRNRVLPRRHAVWIHYERWDSTIESGGEYLASLETAVASAQNQAARALESGRSPGE
jgi:1-acyl-sn-glycerol-3-phosphate acyltransferase